MDNKIYMKLSECIEKISEEINANFKKTNDVFVTNYIVFPTKLMTKWFRSYYLKKHGILMNIEAITLKDALFNILKPNNNFSLASKEEIRLLIIKYLNENKDVLQDKKYKNYFYLDGKLNSLKLYDLATILTSLFSEYEDDLTSLNGDQETIYQKVMDELYKNSITTFGYLYKINENNLNKFSENNRYFIVKTNKFTSLEETIVNKLNFKVYQLELNDIKVNPNVELIKCPSKLREIEIVHSSICKIMKEKKENRDKSINYSDFLVIAPSIKEYETYINQVFVQDDKEYVSIPISMNNVKGEREDLKNALTTLINILNSKNYTRKQFISLIENSIIARKYELSEEDVDIISSTIIDTNVYRIHESCNDWDYLKKRLLLEKLTNNETEIGDSKYLPYSSMELDDLLICKIIQLIDNLDTFIANLSNITVINDESLKVVEEELDKFFSIKNKNEEETNYLYKNILKTLFFFKDYKISNNDIDISLLFLAIKESSRQTIFNKGDMFFHGVSFIDFDYKATYEAKYVYFIGLNDFSLPLSKNISEIDLRKNDPNIDLNKEYVDLQLKAFRLQQINAENFFMSYLYLDVKNNNELFKSYFIEEVFKQYRTKDDKDESKNEGMVEIKKISLDEKRDYGELFTKREFKNKNYYDSLLGSDKENSSNNNEDSNKNIDEEGKPNKFNVKNIRDFLYDPFQFKINYLVSKDDDGNEDKNEQFEIDKIDHLSKYSLLNNLIKEKFTKNQSSDLYEKYEINHELPIISKEITDIAKDNLNKTVDELMEVIGRCDGDFNRRLSKPDSLLLKDDLGREFTIEFKDNYLILENSGKIVYFLAKELEGKNKNLLELYAFSLFDIASRKDEENYTVTLFVDDKKKENQTFNINSLIAKQKLKEIYEDIFDYDNIYTLPYEYLLKYLKDDRVRFNDLIKDLSSSEQGKPWSYFSNKKLFNLEKDIGYTRENFENEFMKNAIKQIKYFIYLNNEGSKNE